MHPYKDFPDRQFWSRGVTTSFVPAEVGTLPRPLIDKGDKIVSAGSCFAANMVPHLEQAGFKYVRTEYTHGLYTQVPAENLGYAKFSAAYGNIYTARQLLQLLRRATGTLSPQEDRWYSGCAIIDPFRPGLRYFARSDTEFVCLTRQHLDATLAALKTADVLIFTLGLTEAWVSKLDGIVFAACPGTIAGRFDPEKHAFVNFTVEEIVADLDSFVGELRAINPFVRLILTVSPVPLVATASGHHVLEATIYSKSVLRVAAEVAVQHNKDVHYFPAYEIVTGPQAPWSFFDEDRRNVSRQAVEAVMGCFLSHCAMDKTEGLPVKDKTAPADKTLHTHRLQNESFVTQLATRISDMECEEAGQDDALGYSTQAMGNSHASPETASLNFRVTDRLRWLWRRILRAK